MDRGYDARLVVPARRKIVDPLEPGDGSITYSLADFGTAGSTGVRRGEDYQRNYFMGRYGGIRDVDIVPFLKKQVEQGVSMEPMPDGVADQDTRTTTNGEVV